jgi:fumarylacetoacetase
MVQSWVETANQPGNGFSLENLPLCWFDHGRAGTVIGDLLVELGAVGGYDRDRLTELLRHDAVQRPPERAIRRIQDVQFAVPEIRNYTDFYASIHHASRIGQRFRPDHPLLPNYTHLPVGYHGRASSIIIGGTPVRRPWGQLGEGLFDPTAELDYEMELGCIVAGGNSLGEPIAAAKAADHILGYCIVNDWSARDIQRWEYQPLGPFLGKSFATSISPFIVVPEALEPYRVPAPQRDVLPYLQPAGSLLDITMEVYVNGELTGRSNTRDLYWTFEQMIAHHTVNGCNLQAGDLIASGTVSGPEAGQSGCLLEDGKPFLRDGDEVLMLAYAERPGLPRISFGECRAVVLPAYF